MSISRHTRRAELSKLREPPGTLADQGCRQQPQGPVVAHYEDAAWPRIGHKLRRHSLLAQEYLADALAPRQRCVHDRRWAVMRLDNPRIGPDVCRPPPLVTPRPKSPAGRCRPREERRATAGQVSPSPYPAHETDRSHTRNRSPRRPDAAPPLEPVEAPCTRAARRSALGGVLPRSTPFPRVAPGRVSWPTPASWGEYTNHASQDLLGARRVSLCRLP